MITKVGTSKTARPLKSKGKKNLFLQMAEDKKAILEELSGKAPKGKSALVNMVNPLS